MTLIQSQKVVGIFIARSNIRMQCFQGNCLHCADLVSVPQKNFISNSLHLEFIVTVSMNGNSGS